MSNEAVIPVSTKINRNNGTAITAASSGVEKAAGLGEVGMATDNEGWLTSV